MPQQDMIASHQALSEGAALLVQRIALVNGQLAPMLQCVCPALRQEGGQLDDASLGVLLATLEAVAHASGCAAPATVTRR